MAYSIYLLLSSLGYVKQGYFEDRVTIHNSLLVRLSDTIHRNKHRDSRDNGVARSTEWVDHRIGDPISQQFDCHDRMVQGEERIA